MQKIFGAVLSHFELIDKLNNCCTHHTCKQNVTIFLSLSFDFVFYIIFYHGILIFVLTFNKGSWGKK